MAEQKKIIIPNNRPVTTPSKIRINDDLNKSYTHNNPPPKTPRPAPSSVIPTQKPKK